MNSKFKFEYLRYWLLRLLMCMSTVHKNIFIIIYYKVERMIVFANVYEFFCHVVTSCHI